MSASTIDDQIAAAARAAARLRRPPVPVATIEPIPRVRRRHRITPVRYALSIPEFIVMGTACSILGGILAAGFVLIVFGGFR